MMDLAAGLILFDTKLKRIVFKRHLVIIKFYGPVKGALNRFFSRGWLCRIKAFKGSVSDSGQVVFLSVVLFLVDEVSLSFLRESF
jgi:hypothetical protein